MRPVRARSRAAVAFTAIVAALVAPAAARAHLVQSGLGPFYDGIAHFALSPDDWLLALALALLGGLSGAAAGRKVLFALPLAWTLGGLAGLGRDTVADWPWLSAAALVVVGALVAWNPRWSSNAPAAIAVVLGGLHGYCNGSLAALDGIELAGIVGIAATTFVVATLAGALVVSLDRPTPRLIVRVAGSWIAAIGLLLIGWTFRA